MKLRIAVLVVVVGLVVGSVWVCGSVYAVAGEQASMAAGSVAMGVLAGGEHEFVGSKKCKMCHSKQYKSWAITTHGTAFDILKPGDRTEAKVKYKLDPAKDYTADKDCLGCHTTGYGKAGGYAVPDAADEKAVKKMAKLAGVGCESCHGPGKDYNKVKKSIKKEKRNYKFDELAAAGMTEIEAGTCTGCHSDKSPTFDASKTLDFEKACKDEKAVHTRIPLKLREG